MPASNIAFRTDATSKIGTGHFMRCLTLAEALKKQGAYIRFVCRGLPAHLSSMLAVKGMQLAQLDDEMTETADSDLAHAQWLGTSQVQDAKATATALSDQVWDWIIVDHYALDARWERMLRGVCKKIMVIDDIADREHDCDVLLDQNYYVDMQERYVGKVPEHCRMLLGPRYALLRQEFQDLRENIKPRTGGVKRILVFFGGVDADNYTGLAIQALAAIASQGVHVDVVIGAQHPSREQIEQACKNLGYICHVQTTRMAQLMAEADMAIGAGGTAIWERCCVGLPALSLSVAENQRRQVLDAAEAGFLYAPAIMGDNLENLVERHIQVLLENPTLLKLISTLAMKAVDGKGTIRIATSLAGGEIEIREANEGDSQKLFEWRNHPNIRAVSRNTAPIVWEDHQRWFNSILADKNRSLLIGEVDGKTVGVVRFDNEDDIAEVSIYLVPQGGFKGKGRNLLLSAELWLKQNKPEIKKVRAEALAGNLISQNLFIAANYHMHSICYMKEL